MTFPYNQGWNPASEPPEPEPTLEDIPEVIHDEHRDLARETVAELDDDETREAFSLWLFDKGEDEFLWAALANNLRLMSQFTSSDIAKRIIETRKDKRLTEFYLKGRK